MAHYIDIGRLDSIQLRAHAMAKQPTAEQPKDWTPKSLQQCLGLAWAGAGTCTETQAKNLRELAPSLQQQGNLEKGKQVQRRNREMNWDLLERSEASSRIEQWTSVGDQS